MKDAKDTKDKGLSGIHENKNDLTFDSLYAGIEKMKRDTENKNQISIFDYDDNFELPEVKQLSNPKTSKKKKSSITKNSSVTKNSSININDIKVHSKEPSGISIDSLRLCEDKDKFKSKGTGVLSITGADKINDQNSVLSTVANKTKQSIDARNAELMRFRTHPYQRIDVMTEAEKKLFKFLRQRLPKEVFIFPKVRMADVVNLIEQISRDKNAFYKIACKHIDFLIMSPDLDLICAVELDDYTHELPRVRLRDEFVAEVMRDCGINFYRIGCKIDAISSEHTKEIEMCVLEYLAPTCPMCGRPMIPRVSKRSVNFGHRFYGCAGYSETGSKKCCYTIDID